MPLLKRKPYVLETPPPDLRPDEYVFQVRHTKEIFRDYEAYLSHMHLYRRRLWTCKVTGKQNLTYEEAVVSERKATEQVQHFPKEFMGPVLSMVQFSPLRTDELVDRVYREFKDRFVLNEEVFGKSTESFCPCKILKVMQPSSKGENLYEVGWLDEHGKRFRVSTEPAENLMRKKYPFTRALLKAFIREAAVSGTARNSIWFVKSKLARKFKISVELPSGIATDELRQHSEAVSLDSENNEGQNTKKRRKREDLGSAKRKTPKKSIAVDSHVRAKDIKMAQKVKALQEDEPTDVGTHKRRNTGEEGVETKSVSDEKPRLVGKVVRKVPSPAPPLIKYPIEDSWVRPCPDDPVFSVRPIPSTDFFLPMECLGNILMIWDFCTSFSKALHLSPFSLEEFEKSLEYREGNAPLITEILFALLQTNLSNPVLWDEFVKKRKRKSDVSINTWMQDLSDLLQLTSVNNLGHLLPLIRQGCYKQFDIAVKLEILLDLVDKSLTSCIIRSQIDENVGEHQALSAKKREEDVESLKRRKQEKLRQLLNGAASERLDANGKSEENGVPYEACHSVDQKDKSDNMGVKNGLNKDVMGDDGQNIGWKTKGKRKLAGNHSPGGTNESSKKEDHLDVGVGGKWRQAYVKQEGLKQAEAEKKFLEENKNVLEKRKGHIDASADCTEQEQIALQNQKRQDHLDRELEKRSIRTTPLGKDRDYNVYWFFPREGRLFVEDKDSTKWGYYSAKEEFEDFLHSLNPKGVRERCLQKQLEKHHNKISNVLLRRSKEISQRIALDEVVVRRSVRVRSAPRLPAFLTYVNKLRQS